MAKKIETNFQNSFLLFLLIVFGFSIYSCVSSSQINKSSNLTRIPGTKAFAKIPSGYVWDEEKSIYRYGDSENYFLCMYFPTDFSSMKKGWSQELVYTPSMKMHSYQKNDMEVVTMSGYVPKEKYQSYFLLMETNNHPLMMMAKITDTTLIAEMNVPTIIESLHHDEAFDLDIFELQAYQFNEKITGFHYYYSFRKNGRADYLREPIKDMDNLGLERISVYCRKKMTEEEIDKRLENVIVNVDTKNMIYYNRTNTIINGFEVSYTEIDAEYEGKPSYTLFAIIRGKEEYYDFMAITNRDVKKMKVKFLATLKSFKVK